MLAELLIFSWAAGFLAYVPFLKFLRNPLLFLQAACGLFASFGLLSASLNVFSILLAIIGLYVAFNVLRVFERRMNERYLKNVSFRSTLIFGIYEAIVCLGWLGWKRLDNPAAGAHTALIVWLGLGIFFATVILISTISNIIKSRPPKIKADFVATLPTLSVCIPARNETEDLKECLESLVASDYPKLEIVVLDDCSQTRRTPEIIRSFAQKGAEFMSGTEPEAHWLAKNWAYEQLLNAANGELVLFCGVDARFTPESLRQIVRTLIFSKKKMMSIVPERLDRQFFSLVQPMRYFWEMSMPRGPFKRPPVLSTCWVAERKIVLKLGGFSAVTRQIVPEAYFAKRLARAHKYAFVRSLGLLGVSTRKSIAEQRATTLRTRYPQLHRRPEWVLLLTVAELAFLVSPFVIFIAGWLMDDKIFLILSAISLAQLIVAYELMILATINPSALFSLVSFPFVVMADVVLANASMYKYEFSTIEWKGRNICIPAMHVYSHLPDLK